MNNYFSPLFRKILRPILNAANFLRQFIITYVNALRSTKNSKQPEKNNSSSKFFICGSLLFLLSEFAPLCNTKQHNADIVTKNLEHALQIREYEEFIIKTEKNPLYSSSQNELLFNLDTGIAEVFNKNFISGTKKLIKVGEMGEEFYTKSISRNVLSVLTNDLALPYYGEDYELTFAGNLAALAFAATENPEDALVEARKSEHRLKVMSDAYEGKDKYSDDAFAHYLAGMLFDASGNYNDAVVSYKLAYNGYGNRFFPMRPDGLTKALIGAAVAGKIDPGFGFQTISDSLLQIDKEISLRNDPSSSYEYIKNSMILIAFTGRGPKKVEHVLKAHFTDEGLDYTVKIAIPEMVRRKSSIASVRFRLDDGNKQEMELVADYNHIGVNAFKDKKNFIYAKTLARVSTRYLITKKTKEKSLKKLRENYDKAVEEHGKNSLEARTARLKVKAAAVAIDLLANELLEHADTRCSIALPGRVFIARVNTSPESHRVRVEYLDRSGSVLDTEEQMFLFEPEKGFVKIFTALF